MTAIATVRHTILDRISRRDEIERVIARFARHRILPRPGHVALNAAAAGAQRTVVGVVGK